MSKTSLIIYAILNKNNLKYSNLVMEDIMLMIPFYKNLKTYINFLCY